MRFGFSVTLRHQVPGLVWVSGRDTTVLSDGSPVAELRRCSGLMMLRTVGAGGDGVYGLRMVSTRLQGWLRDLGVL